MHLLKADLSSAGRTTLQRLFKSTSSATFGYVAPGVWFLGLVSWCVAVGRVATGGGTRGFGK